MSSAQMPGEPNDSQELVVLTVESADDAQLIRRFLAEVPWLEVRIATKSHAA